MCICVYMYACVCVYVWKRKMRQGWGGGTQCSLTGRSLCFAPKGSCLSLPASSASWLGQHQLGNVPGHKKQSKHLQCDVCISACVCVCMYVCTHVCMCVYVCCVCARTCVVCVHVHVLCVCTYMCCVCARTCVVCVHIHMCVQGLGHTFVYSASAHMSHGKMHTCCMRTVGYGCIQT